MAQIGIYGKKGKFIKFKVEKTHIRTFHDFSQVIEGRWGEHDIIKKKPRGQYLGPALRTITFTMEFSIFLGIKNPWHQVKKLREIAEKGKVGKLSIGGHRVGHYKWGIESLSEAWEVFGKKGDLESVSVEVTLKEYR